LGLKAPVIYNRHMAAEDRIQEIEEELHKTVYNKATQYHIGKLKAKLAQLKEEDLKRKSSGKKAEASR